MRLDRDENRWTVPSGDTHVSQDGVILSIDGRAAILVVENGLEGAGRVVGLLRIGLYNWEGNRNDVVRILRSNEE